MLAAGFVMQAQAEDQPAAQSAPVSPSQSSSSATPATETTTAATPEAEAAEQERLEAAEFERVAKEYQKTEKDGQALYCRKEKTLGTRLAKTVRLTETQLRARIRRAEEARGLTKPGVGCQPLLIATPVRSTSHRR